MYLIAIASFYSFFVLLLYSTLKSTCWRPPNSLFFAHAALLLFVVALYFGAFLNILCLYLCIAVLICGCLHVVFVFNEKLFAVALAQRTRGFDNEQVGAVTVNDRQRHILRVATKMSCLIMTIFAFVLLFFVSEFVWICFAPNLESVTGALLETMMKGCCAGAELAVFMTFTMNRRCYDVCCSRCDDSLQVCCERIAVNTIRKRRDEAIAANREDRRCPNHQMSAVHVGSFSVTPSVMSPDEAVHTPACIQE